MSNPQPRILVADDDAVGRAQLKGMLKAEGFEPILAQDGLEAVDLFHRKHPDLVLMDARMPRMTGWEAARLIKAQAGERFVPIIFITGVEDEALLVHCIEAGGDDFLTKPWSRPILTAKITALLRVGRLYREMKDQRDISHLHQQTIRQEVEMAERISARSIDEDTVNVPWIRHHSVPAAIFSGDRVLAGRAPSGRLVAMVGDASGHSIAAAHCAMPATELFLRMVPQGFDIDDIARAIHNRLKEILPPGIFFAAVLLSLDPATGRLRVLNAGMPDVLILRESGQLDHVASDHLPLGILPLTEFTARVSTRIVEPGDRLYAYSDGVIETRNPDGGGFGQDRLEAELSGAELPSPGMGLSGQTGVVERLISNLHSFRGRAQPTDDTSIIEITVPERSGRPAPVGSTGFRLSIELKADALKEQDPISGLVDQIVNHLGEHRHRERIRLILSELYNNALEHGLLRLDGQLKRSTEGYSKYYAERATRLMELHQGWINIEVLLFKGREAGQVVARVEDSGPGFDPHKAAKVPPSYGGRGIFLVRQFCDRVRYLGRGNRVEIIYTCDDQDPTTHSLAPLST
ncbi:MAG: SpoIIE family protein phosphatase [Bradymonadia bacterium]